MDGADVKFWLKLSVGRIAEVIEHSLSVNGADLKVWLKLSVGRID